MALILNIETSASVCSVALAQNGNIISCKETSEDRQHAKVLSEFIRETLEEKHLSVQDLDAVAVSMGPGSYTGLRIGVSTAKGLCYGANIPLIGISTLHSMAAGFKLTHNDLTQPYYLCPMIDARRMEVYTATYDQSLNEVLSVSAKIITEDSFSTELAKQQVIFFGDAASKCKDIIKHHNAFFDIDFKQSARFLCFLSEMAYESGKFEDVAYFEPFYLKDFLATTPKNKVLKL